MSFEKEFPELAGAADSAKVFGSDSNGELRVSGECPDGFSPHGTVADWKSYSIKYDNQQRDMEANQQRGMV